MIRLSPYRKSLFLLAVVAIILIGARCHEEQKPKIVVHGSTTIHPMLEKVSQAFMKRKKGRYIELRADGSRTGIEDLINGTCDIATSSSPISSQFRKKAQSKGILLKEFIFAYDIIVPIVHPTNPVQNLTINQLKGIFTGSIKSWDQVGGKSATIKPVSRDTTSGTREVWQRTITGTDNTPKEQAVRHTNSEVLACVAKNPNAIGYIGFDYLNNEIKPLSVNGIAPNLKTAKERKYPIYRNLYLYADGKKYNRRLKSFIIYIMSSEGQRIVEKNGYIPLYPFSVKE